MTHFWSQVTTLAFALFLLMDSIGNIPIFISVLKEIPPRRQRLVIFREMLIALAIIIIFQFLGDALLDLLHVTLPSIQISGGVILFLIALKMIFPPSHSTELPRDKEPLVVPLAIPLIAGPAVLAAVMLYSGQHHNPMVLVSAILIAWAISTLILLSASIIKRWLGPRGIIALEKLMGLILTLLAIEMLLEGIHLFIQAQ